VEQIGKSDNKEKYYDQWFQGAGPKKKGGQKKTGATGDPTLRTEAEESRRQGGALQEGGQ